jgi:hypothetical protein
MPAHDPGERSTIARIAALTRSAKSSGAERMEAAQAAYRKSFTVRHECNLCGLVEIDQSLPAEEIGRRAQAAFRAHMQRLAYHRGRAQRNAAAAAAVIAEVDAELDGLASAS